MTSTTHADALADLTPIDKCQVLDAPFNYKANSYPHAYSKAARAQRHRGIAGQ
jgi:hypothetical protein